MTTRPSHPALILPAPLWRRLAAAVYDTLLLLGVWMGTTLLFVPARDVLGLGNGALPALLFLTGGAFFGWSWTHGGRTPGMLAWQLQVRSNDAFMLRWPAAVGRYAVMLASWGLVLLTLLPVLPARWLQRVPHASLTAVIAVLLVLPTLVLFFRDPRRRAPCDLLAASEVVLLPKSDRQSAAGRSSA